MPIVLPLPPRLRSSIPSVTTAAIALLSSQLAGQKPDGSPVPVYDGDMSSDVPDEFVVVGGVSNGQQVWGAIGTQRRNEHFDIDCMVRVWAGGDAQAPLRQRCFDLLALIELALVQDPSLGGTVNGAVQFSASDCRWGPLDGGRYCEADFTLSVVTQLIAQ